METFSRSSTFYVISLGIITPTTSRNICFMSDEFQYITPVCYVNVCLQLRNGLEQPKVATVCLDMTYDMIVEM